MIQESEIKLLTFHKECGILITRYRNCSRPDLTPVSRKRKQFTGNSGLQPALLNVPGSVKEAKPMESMESQQLTVSSAAVK